MVFKSKSTVSREGGNRDQWNTYSYTISCTPSCDCLYFLGHTGKICKHIIWTLMNLLQILQGNSLLYQVALTEREFAMLKTNVIKDFPDEIRYCGEQSGIQPENHEQSGIQRQSHGHSCVQQQSDGHSNVQQQSDRHPGVQQQIHGHFGIQQQSHGHSGVQRQSHRHSGVQPQNHGRSGVQQQNHHQSGIHPQIPPRFPIPSPGAFWIYLLSFCPTQMSTCYGCGASVKPGGRIPKHPMISLSSLT